MCSRTCRWLLPRSFNRTSVRLKHELGGGVFGIVTLQPHERSSETGPPGHWRATASRLQPHERSSETTWDQALSVANTSFNRTSVRLKLAHFGLLEGCPRCFNRTSVRLKLPSMATPRRRRSLQPHERSSETRCVHRVQHGTRPLQPHERSSETPSPQSSAAWPGRFNRTSVRLKRVQVLL